MSNTILACDLARRVTSVRPNKAITLEKEKPFSKKEKIDNIAVKFSVSNV
jgi:hypothetical protein